MEKLLTLLNEQCPYIDFVNEKHLIENGLLDSVAVMNIISAIEDEFDISVDMEYIQPRYFESVECMWEMISELS